MEDSVSTFPEEPCCPMISTVSFRRCLTCSIRKVLACLMHCCAQIAAHGLVVPGPLPV